MVMQWKAIRVSEHWQFLLRSLSRELPEKSLQVLLGSQKQGKKNGQVPQIGVNDL